MQRLNTEFLRLAFSQFRALLTGGPSIAKVLQFFVIAPNTNPFPEIANSNGVQGIIFSTNFAFHGPSVARAALTPQGLFTEFN